MAFSRYFCPTRLKVIHTYIDTLMVVAAMQGADQHMRSSLGFSILPKDTSACRTGETNQRLITRCWLYPWAIATPIFPVLDYGDTVYSHVPVSVLKPLYAVYHSALRFIAGAGFQTHHCVLYSTVGWTSLGQRRKQHSILFIYKAIIGKQLTTSESN